MIESDNGSFCLDIFEEVAHKNERYFEVAVFFGKEAYTYRRWFKDQECLEGFVDDLRKSGYRPGYFRKNKSWTKRIVGMIF